MDTRDAAEPGHHLLDPTIMTRSRLLAAIVALTPLAAHGQIPEPRNLKVFPAGTSRAALIETMRGFTRALGVRCTHCHVGEEGQPLTTYDFASDSKAPKEKARVMLRMVNEINSTHLAGLPARTSPPLQVTCTTCHRGVREPRAIEDILLHALSAGGADSVDRAYRGLRQRYYGRSAYDFGEVALAEVAATAEREKKVADAVRLHQLNMEFNPRSGFAHRQAAAAQAAAGDTAAAVATLQKALGIDPNDAQAKAQLQSLGRRP